MSVSKSEFLDELLENGMDNGTIVDQVRQWADVDNRLVLFLKRSIGFSLQNEPQPPKDILETALSLGLMEQHDEYEYVYKYSEDVIAASGEEK